MENHEVLLIALIGCICGVIAGCVIDFVKIYLYKFMYKERNEHLQKIADKYHIMYPLLGDARWTIDSIISKPCDCPGAKKYEAEEIHARKLIEKIDEVI